MTKDLAAPTDRLDLLVVDSLHGEIMPPDAAARPAQVERTPTRREITELLQQWEARFVRAKAVATVKAVRADWGVVVDWCERTGRYAIPMSEPDLVTFLEDMVTLGKKHSTLARYIQTINTIHGAAQLPSPTRHSHWKLDWEGIRKRLADLGLRQPKQAEPLRTEAVQQILSSLGDTPIDLRDAAIISLASDSLCRESELVAIRLQDLKPSGDGWTVDLRKSKTDQEGLGDVRYCSVETKERIDLWCQLAGITEGFLFRGIGRRRDVTAEDIASRGPLKPPEIARIIRTRAVAAGLENGTQFTGHSTRVGSAIDLLENDASVAAVQFAGGWNGERMVLHYGKRARAGRNVMAELRSKQRSRDKQS